jgi:phage-related protein
MFTVEFYQLPDGSEPAKDFIISLNANMRMKAVYTLSILEEFGNTLREPYSKPVGDGLFELRIKFASDITRLFYFFIVGNKIIVTNGFIKKTQKTPASEIEKARKYKRDYERRHNNE